MSHSAVIRQEGPAGAHGGIGGQPDVAGHAVCMTGLAEEDFVRVAGPLEPVMTKKARRRGPSL
jgi:hypothetical protein